MSTHVFKLILFITACFVAGALCVIFLLPVATAPGAAQAIIFAAAISLVLGLLLFTALSRTSISGAMCRAGFWAFVTPLSLLAIWIVFGLTARHR
jgi:nitrogen fixation/metabolism regulation signal transduction histidine kinase